MDIFTTQLARVVPVTIQPEKLKVKALVKESALGKLKDDMTAVDPNDYAFYHSASHQQQSQQHTKASYSDNQQEEEQVPADVEQAYDKKMLVHKKLPLEGELLDDEQKEKIKHLDIFV